jgi:hypothetical protein
MPRPWRKAESRVDDGAPGVVSSGFKVAPDSMHGLPERADAESHFPGSVAHAPYP